MFVPVMLNDSRSHDHALAGRRTLTSYHMVESRGERGRSYAKRLVRRAERRAHKQALRQEM